eukprot:scaffold80947_cov29-Tisochrysis_lutea.AAC.5
MPRRVMAASHPGWTASPASASTSERRSGCEARTRVPSPIAAPCTSTPSGGPSSGSGPTWLSLRFTWLSKRSGQPQPAQTTASRASRRATSEASRPHDARTAS